MSDQSKTRFCGSVRHLFIEFVGVGCRTRVACTSGAACSSGVSRNRCGVGVRAFPSLSVR